MSKHDVLSIEMRRRLKRDEELTLVGVLPGVRHAQYPGLVMQPAEGFIAKRAARRDRRVPTRPIEALKVSTLRHEVGDHAMELASSVRWLRRGLGGNAFLFRVAQCDEVLARLRTILREEFDDDRQWITSSYGNHQVAMAFDRICHFS